MAKQPKQTRHPVIHHYYRIMPNRRRYRLIVWVIFLLTACVLAFQIGYPGNRTVPFARLGGQWVGWQTDVQIGERVNKAFLNTKISLATSEKKTSPVFLRETGAEPAADRTARALSEYPFWQRFVPFSVLWQLPHADTLDVDYAYARLKTYASQQSSTLSYAPVNASLAIQGDKLIATADKPGSEATAADIIKALNQADIAFDKLSTVNVATKKLPPAKTAKDLADVRAQAEAALARPLAIAVEGKLFTPPADVRAAWLVLGTNEAGQTTLSLERAKTAQYLDELNKQAGTPAGTTNVTLQNGIETARSVGVTGRRIQSEPLIDLISRYLLESRGRSPLIAEVVNIAPTISFNSTYTATLEGLQAYTRDQAKNGAWFSIRQIGGNGWAVDADAGESVVSASTYKLFVAKMLFAKMESGEIKWDDPMLDTSVNGCFDRMTIASTNSCAVEWLRQWGRDNVNDYVWSQGFSHATSFTNPEAVHTSAADLTRYMVGLENGSLVGGAYRDRLLKSLSSHPYRYGIPTGSKGKVYDKVGFLWNYVHDTAIVYHPRGTYVMTIMTKGKSYAAIASMTRQIEAIMYP